MHVSQLIKKYTLCIWSFLSINYTVIKLKKQFAHPWVTDQQWQRGRRTRGFGGSSSEGSLCQVLTSELRAEWLLLPPTSPVTSGSPLPCLRNIWGELHHLPSPTPGSAVSPLTSMEHALRCWPSIACLHPLWDYGEESNLSRRDVFILPFCTHHTDWQNSQKSPINLSSTINLQCLDKTFRKWVEVSQSMRQMPYNLQNTTEKQPTLALNYCGLSKSIQSNMQGDKAILPGRQIFQITGS